MKILYAASEIFPYAKTGGLADVAYALPRSLAKHIDIVSVMPLYGFMDRLSFKSEISFTITFADAIHDISIFKDDNNSVITYFVDTPLFSDNNSGSYANNNPSFGLFCMAIVKLAQKLDVDIVHLNDWHTALSALWMKEYAPKIKTIFTIHSLAYQGLFDASMLEYFGIDKKYFTMDGIEFYNQMSFIKAGIAFSNIITTVSPQYAKEIMSERFGCGLHSFLKQHSNKLSGILNGIDTEFFNPQTDKALVENFNSNNIDSKYLNKIALIKEIELKDSAKPLFIMVSRLVEQKGFDLLIESMDEILEKNLNLIILIDGINIYKSKLEFIAKKYDNLHLVLGYEEGKSHRIYSAGDFLLMPSLFEPCGLSQMIAMRYGAIPIVHGVGGLLDTVHENKDKCGKGIVFLKPNKKEFLSAIERALELNKNSNMMHKIIRFNMKCDFSFEKGAESYIELYKELLS